MVGDCSGKKFDPIHSLVKEGKKIKSNGRIFL